MQHLAKKETQHSIAAPIVGLLVLICLSVGAWTSVQYLDVAPIVQVPDEVLPSKRPNIRPNSNYAATLRQAPVDLGGPQWSELSNSQRDALAPLLNQWNTLSEPQKRHWLTLASNFSSMTDEEKEKMLSRMTEWANLSAQQRSQARLNFAATATLSPDDKRAKWEAYQALSEDEKKRLAARATHKPFGAAVSLKPVSPKRLVRVPAATTVAPNQPNPPKIPPIADYHAPHIYPPPAPPPSVPAIVETAPVQGASAVPEALPPMNPASAAEPDEPIDLRDITSVNSPQ